VVRFVLTTFTVGALVLAGALVPQAARGDGLDDKQKAAQSRAAEARVQYEMLQESVEDLSADLAQAVVALEETKAQVPAAQAALETATSEAQAAERRAVLARDDLQDATDVQTALSAQLERDSARTDAVRATVAQLARQAYQGGTTSVLEIAVGASSAEEFTAAAQTATTAQRLQDRALDELTELASTSRTGQARLDAVVSTLDDLEDAAQQHARAAEAARAARQEQSDALARTVAEQTAASRRLEGMKGQAEQEQAKADADRAAAEAEIAQIAAQQEAQEPQQPSRSEPAPPAPPPAGPPAAPPAGGGPVGPPPSSGAVFSNPTSIQPMYVTSKYGMRLHPILGYYRLHAGIDLRTYCNTPLYAPRDGVVQWAEWRNGFGNQVMLNYGTVNGQSLMSSSNHLTRSVVSAGQAVARGQLIGYSGNTGLSGACHLHFEVYVGGSTVDPAPLLGLR
jgi:murein DD-endopeptidase MepM/ murein hydrolase activator NlpD